MGKLTAMGFENYTEDRADIEAEEAAIDAWWHKNYARLIDFVGDNTNLAIRLLARRDHAYARAMRDSTARHNARDLLNTIGIDKVEELMKKYVK